MEENPEDGTVCELKETELLDGTKERLSFEFNYRFTDCLGDLENTLPPSLKMASPLSRPTPPWLMESS